MLVWKLPGVKDQAVGSLRHFTGHLMAMARGSASYLDSDILGWISSAFILPRCSLSPYFPQAVSNSQLVCIPSPPGKPVGKPGPHLFWAQVNHVVSLGKRKNPHGCENKPDVQILSPSEVKYMATEAGSSLPSLASLQVQEWPGCITCACSGCAGLAPNLLL